MLEASSLSEVFAATRGEATADAALEPRLREYLQAAYAVWADLGVGEAEFVRYIAARCSAGELPPVAHAADLLLACASSGGDERAVAAFQREYAPVIGRVLAHRKAPQDVADDARQIVHERLLVGDASKGARPKIADYLGAGPLKSWVASTAATTLLMLQRSSNRRREQLQGDTPEAALDVQLDPELEYLKERYKAEVEDAILYALGQLEERSKTLLRLYLGERLSIDVLGSMYSVNRATAARWITAARRALMNGARARLRSQLQLSESECDSLVALVNSRLEVSIVRQLAES